MSYYRNICNCYINLGMGNGHNFYQNLQILLYVAYQQTREKQPIYLIGSRGQSKAKHKISAQKRVQKQGLVGHALFRTITYFHKKFKGRVQLDIDKHFFRYKANRFAFLSKSISTRYISPSSYRCSVSQALHLFFPSPCPISCLYICQFIQNMQCSAMQCSEVHGCVIR